MSFSKTVERPLQNPSAHTPSGFDMEEITRSILAGLDIEINGERPWDIQVHNKAFYRRVVTQNSLGLGESYMDGWWDCASLDQLFEKVCKACREDRVQLPGWLLVQGGISAYLSESWMKRLFLNPQNKAGASENVRHHYDLGNDFYQAMLDQRMAYTCGSWKEALTLDEAQDAKLEWVCRKLDLRPGMRVLDIGCGWGSWVKYAAEHYGVKAVGITLSEEQAFFARESCRDLPIEIRVQDYRDINEEFDRIASLGMFEHVGKKNYRTYMQAAHRCLKPAGRFVLQTIGGNCSTLSFDPWLDKYIFPGAGIPSIKQIGQAMEGLFMMEEWNNIGPDYDKTLMSWFENFDRNWPRFKERYGERFYRMWKYYLLTCAGMFRGRHQQLWRLLLSK